MKKVNKPVKAYKGFNKHMQCTPNGKIFQYEIGKEYKEDEANLCHCGFHACENPLDVLSYYNNIDDKFCEVELDKIDPNRNKDSKICGKKIKIGIECAFYPSFMWKEGKLVCGDICHTLYGVSYDPKLCCGKEDDAFYIGTHFIDLYRDYLLLE